MHGRAIRHGASLGKNSLIQVINDWEGLLEVFIVVLFRVPEPKLCLEESGPRLKVQVRGRLSDVLWGLGLRNTGSRA